MVNEESWERRIWYSAYCSDTNSIWQQAPKRTGHEGYKLICKAQTPNRISNTLFSPNKVSDHEGDRRVKEYQEGDGEGTNT